MIRHILALTIALTILVIYTSESAYAATAQVTISNGASTTNSNCSTTNCFDPQVVNINVGKLPVTAPIGNYNITTNAQVNGSTVPEFGPVASIVLTIALISIVVFTARNRGTQNSKPHFRFI
jgi:predicted secreted protein with PEFG-CTERM motif